MRHAASWEKTLEPLSLLVQVQGHSLQGRRLGGERGFKSAFPSKASCSDPPLPAGYIVHLFGAAAPVERERIKLGQKSPSHCWKTLKAAVLCTFTSH